MTSFLGKVFEPVFLARVAIGLASAAITAFTISFWVSDYVVRANTATMSDTFSAIQSSLDRINDTLNVTNTELVKVRDEIGGLRADTSSQMTEIGYIRRDLGKVQAAVQGAGIAIPVDGAPFIVDPGAWKAIFEQYNLNGDTPIFLEINPEVIPK